MKPTEIKALIKARVQAGIKRSILIESSPGLGKTQITEQAAKELGVDYRVIHAPLMQPEDYGFPVISADRSNVEFIVSKSKFPVVGSDCADHGILTIDELSQADNAGQKVIANLMQAREIHGQKLKDGWMIVATGNRTTDRSGANRILGHLGNRVTRIEMEASLDDWTQWAIQNGVKTELIAFLRFRPELLSQYDPQSEINATPRAWAEGVSASLGVIDAAHEFPVFKGDVGEGPAAEFCAFLKIFRKLPSPDAILLNPANSEVPTDPATLYALCGALAHKASDSNFKRIMTYVNRMPTEFTVLFIRDAIKRNPALQTSADFIAWASSDGAKVLL